MSYVLSYILYGTNGPMGSEQMDLCRAPNDPPLFLVFPRPEGFFSLSVMLRAEPSYLQPTAVVFVMRVHVFISTHLTRLLYQLPLLQRIVYGIPGLFLHALQCALLCSLTVGQSFPSHTTTVPHEAPVSEGFEVDCPCALSAHPSRSIAANATVITIAFCV